MKSSASFFEPRRSKHAKMLTEKRKNDEKKNFKWKSRSFSQEKLILDKNRKLNKVEKN
jgi:hypothetical protein